jgi:FkbM family methyltransferase
MLTTQLGSVYRSLLPLRWRAPLFHLRSLGRAAFAHDRWDYREQLSKFYRSIGNDRPTVRTAAGTRLAVDLRDQGVGWPIFMEQKYEPAETRFIERTLRPGDVFVDIGANIGYFSTLASRLVGPAGRVIAFEPDPETCQLLRGNLRRNRAANAVVCECALGSESGMGRLYRSDSNFGDHRVAAGTEDRQSVPIALRRFDEVAARLGLDRVDFIKIDVQGYEPQVFAGMDDSLDRLGVENVLMEFWPYGIRYAGSCPAALLERIVSLNFTMHELDDRGQAVAADPHDVLQRMEAMNQERPLTFANLVLRKGRGQ